MYNYLKKNYPICLWEKEQSKFDQRNGHNLLSLSKFQKKWIDSWAKGEEKLAPLHVWIDNSRHSIVKNGHNSIFLKISRKIGTTAGRPQLQPNATAGMPGMTIRCLHRILRETALCQMQVPRNRSNSKSFIQVGTNFQAKNWTGCKYRSEIEECSVFSAIIGMHYFLPAVYFLIIHKIENCALLKMLKCRSVQGRKCMRSDCMQFLVIKNCVFRYCT